MSVQELRIKHINLAQEHALIVNTIKKLRLDASRYRHGKIGKLILDQGYSYPAAAEDESIQNCVGRTEAQVASFQRHIDKVIRPIARETNLAYGMMRGRSYSQIEEFARSEPNWQRIKSAVLRFTEPERRGDVELAVDNWIATGKHYFELQELLSKLEQVYVSPGANKEQIRTSVKSFIEKELA